MHGEGSPPKKRGSGVTSEKCLKFKMQNLFFCGVSAENHHWYSVNARELQVVTLERGSRTDGQTDRQLDKKS